MFETIMKCFMIKMIMQPTVLAVCHRTTVGLTVIQLPVIRPMLQIVVMAGVVGVSSGVSEVDLGSGRCGK